MVGEIQGLTPGYDGIKPVDNKKMSKVHTAPVPATDSVTLSSELAGIVNSESANVDFPPRMEKVNEVKSRIANRDYENSEVVEEIAARVAESPSLQEIGLARAAMDAADAPDDAGIEAARSNAASGYYTSADVLRTMADNLIDALGFSGLM